MLDHLAEMQIAFCSSLRISWWSPSGGTATVRLTTQRTSIAVRRPASPSSAASRRLDGGDVDLLHGHHRLEGALGLSATGRQRLGQRARGDLPGEAPAVLAPTARAFLAAIADDRIPVAVRLRLIVRGDLEGERLAMLERRAAVETQAGNTDDGELHRQN